MKTKGKEDILIVRRKTKSQSETAKARTSTIGKTDTKTSASKESAMSTKRPIPQEQATAKEAPSVKKNEVPRHSSLVSRITAFYTNMFATWLSISLAVVFILVIVFNVLFMVYDNKPALEEIGQPVDTIGFIDKVNALQGARMVLMNEKGEMIASSFKEVTSAPSTGLAGISLLSNKVFLTHGKHYTIDMANLTLVIYYDISLILLEILVIGAAAILLFLVTILTIYVRGNYLTRKAFGVLDELIFKASNISSQNLNLRLNVSNSTDELIEFAVTFNRMMDRIEKAYEKQNQFVSDASHELRTPIAVIQGYARMLERWGKDDKEILQESIGAINKESKNMQDLVDKLLFIARNDKDTLVLVKNHFDMSELILELARDTRMLETHHEIRSFVQPDVKVFGDRDRIKQALRIFVDNALKYTEPNGTITLRLDVEGDQAIAVVKDTGMGIPEKDLSNIFDRFYRVDTARERNKGGHGLGLSIARIIILRHGGRIRVASKIGEGTRFSIYLPMEKPLENMDEIKE